MQHLLIDLLIFLIGLLLLTQLLPFPWEQLLLAPNHTRLLCLGGGAGLLVLAAACQNDSLLAPATMTHVFLPRLSQYGIFQGNPANLVPTAEYHLYELSSTLFSDYTEKQRLIRLPTGTTLTAGGDGLPTFPDGTIIVKTFYYYHDQRYPSQGKRLLETRLLLKNAAGWNVATYRWNDAQQEATLLTSGFNQTINGLDAEGRPRVVNYHVPSTRECATCHHTTAGVVPIGPKLRNLNRLVSRNGRTVNQLDFLHQMGVLGSANLTAVAALPDYANPTATLPERARAYLEINCAHCHNGQGYAAGTKLYLNYEQPYDQTGIADKKDQLVQLMEAGRMPRLGPTLVDEAGLDLLKAYINTL